MDPPLQVRRAIALLWASLAIGALMTIMAWEPFPDEMKEFDSWMWGIMGVSFGFIALLIFLISRRKNWARIVMLLLTVAGIAFYFVFPEEMEFEASWSVAADLFVTVLDIVALYWLFSKPGSEWFAHREIPSAIAP